MINFNLSRENNTRLMAHSQCGPGQVQGEDPGLMVHNKLYRNVHTVLRQGQEPGPIVSHYISSIPCPTPVTCRTNKP